MCRRTLRSTLASVAVLVWKARRKELPPGWTKEGETCKSDLRGPQGIQVPGFLPSPAHKGQRGWSPSFLLTALKWHHGDGLHQLELLCHCKCSIPCFTWETRILVIAAEKWFRDSCPVNSNCFFLEPQYLRQGEAFNLSVQNISGEGKSKAPVPHPSFTPGTCSLAS